MKSLFKKKRYQAYSREEGSALALVLSLLVIVTTFLLLYFMFQRINLYVIGKETAYYKASLNALSATRYAKTLEPLATLYETTSLSKNDFNAEIHRYLIGFTEHITSIGLYQHATVRRHTVFGFKTDVFKNVALVTYGKSYFNPLYVTGETDIQGDVITGRYGLSKQSIKDVYYKKPQLINGTLIKRDQSAMPTLELHFLDLIRSSIPKKTFEVDTLKKCLYLNFQTITLSELSALDIHTVIGPGTVKGARFPSKIKRWKYVNLLLEQETELNGDVFVTESFIYSKAPIRIDGIYRNIQLVSASGIIFGETAKLVGSNLAMVLGKSSDFQVRLPVVRFQPSSSFEGTLVYVSPENSDYRDHLVPFDIPAQTRLKGVVYSPFGVPSEITIEGIIFMNYTQFRYKGTVYQNYLKDLMITAQNELQTYPIFSMNGERYEKQSVEIYH